MVGDLPQAVLRKQRLFFLGDDVVAIDRITVGLDVVGREVLPARVRAHEAVKSPRAFEVLNHSQRAAIYRLQVEPRILLTAAVARHDEPAAVGRHVLEAGAILAAGHLDREALWSLEPPDMRSAGDAPAEEELFPIWAQHTQSRRSQVEDHLDATTDLVVERRRGVLPHDFGGDASRTVTLVTRL